MHPIYHYDNNFVNDPKPFGDLCLYQLGEMICTGNTVVDSHTHMDWFEITYVISGKGKIFANDVSADAGEGDLYLSLPREIHRIVSDPADPLRFGFCAFNFLPESPLYPLLNSEKMLHLGKNQRLFRFSHLTDSLRNFFAEIDFSTDLSALLLEHELKALILRLLREVEQIPVPSHSHGQVSGRERLCFDAVNYIDANLTSIRHLSEVSDALGYHYSYLSRTFRNLTGNTMGDYFSNRKLALAAQLLETGDESVTKISERLGFSSIYVFSRAFRSKYGCAPNEWRKGQKKLNKK